VVLISFISNMGLSRKESAIVWNTFNETILADCSNLIDEMLEKYGSESKETMIHRVDYSPSYIVEIVKDEHGQTPGDGDVNIFPVFIYDSEEDENDSPLFSMKDQWYQERIDSVSNILALDCYSDLAPLFYEYSWNDDRTACTMTQFDTATKIEEWTALKEQVIADREAAQKAQEEEAAKKAATEEAEFKTAVSSVVAQMTPSSNT